MAELLDGQFEIDGVTFGGPYDRVKIVKVDFPVPSWGTEDSDNTFTPGLMMGTDLLRPGQFVFELRTDTYTIDNAKAAAEELAAAWLRGGTRKPGDMSILRYRVGNRVRRVYGRGRNYSHDFDQWSYSGTSPILASFDMDRHLFFDDLERDVLVGYTPPVTGGLVAPLSAPLTATGTGATGVGGFIGDVGGTAPTPVVIELHGPTQYATVVGDTWSVEYAKPIAADQVVTIDTRHPYSLVYDNFGRILNGNLSWKTNLQRATITPGSEMISYKGYDTTNTSYARVKWRAAYMTY